MSGASGVAVDAPGAGAPAISIRGLVKRYDGRAVVDRLDLDVRRGEVLALLGPNGAGKTTTVEILEGYRRPDAGAVRVLGLDPDRDGRALRARIGLMLQGGGVYPGVRPREILALFARFYADPRDPDELLDLVGLGGPAATTRYRVLSGGQKQRLGLALALVGRPELALLDEPTAGMDPAAKAATRALIADLRASGVTILLTTHELADVERLADRVAIIDRGRLVALGTTAELTAGGAASLRFRVARTLAPAELADLATTLSRVRPTHGVAPRTTHGVAPRDVEEPPVVEAPHILDTDRPGAYRLVGSTPTPAAIACLAGWCADRALLLLEVRTEGGTLEERYLELTGDAPDDAEMAS